MDKTWKTKATFYLNGEKYNVLCSNEGEFEVEWERKIYGATYRSLINWEVFGDLSVLSDGKGSAMPSPPKLEVKVPITEKKPKKESKTINKNNKMYRYSRKDKLKKKLNKNR